MKNWISKIYKLLNGRYGNDKLNQFISLISFIIYFIAIITHIRLLIVFSLAGFSIALYRSLSKDIYKRTVENQRFNTIVIDANKKLVSIKWINILQLKYKYRKTHKVIICKQCHQAIRVPKNKGKIEVTCPKCKYKHIIKS